MTIFVGSVFGLLASVMIVLVYIGGFMLLDKADEWKLRTVIVLIILTFTLTCCITITITTEEENIYVAQYVAQKQTIEQSLRNENLTGLERVELVQKATELNGELAKRKARYSKWYYVVWGEKNLYDDIELINLGK